MMRVPVMENLPEQRAIEREFDLDRNWFAALLKEHNKEAARMASDRRTER